MQILFLKSFFSRCFFHIFTVANQLPGFSISRLANVENFLNANIFLNCKYKCDWKQGPNWPFYVLMLRTKLYQNPFFFSEDQNVNKPKSRAARTVYEPIFLPFCKIIVTFFSFFLSGCKQNKIKSCYNWLQFVKETQTNTYKTQSGEPNYVARFYV